MMTEYLLPLTEDELSSFVPPSPRQVLRICLNLKHLIDSVVPIQFEEAAVVSPESRIINEKVVKLALQAAGGLGDGKPGSSSEKYRAVLIFALLKVTSWYWDLAATEIHDSELFFLRASAAQMLAKHIIEREENDKYLFIQMLCRRYVVNLNTEDSEPANALELAVDMHSLIVIGSSGYQRCLKWLWRGWIVQSARDPSSYILYKDVNKATVSAHFDADRIKTPLYQNSLEIFFSILYLLIYTVVVNTTDRGIVPMDVFEYAFYLFTFGLIHDELTKLYHVGWNYLSFSSILNDCMYALSTASFVLRLLALSKGDWKSSPAVGLDEASYRILALAAPLMYARLLLFLDAQKFVGAMIVVIKMMLRESIIFFVLITMVILGFLQGFLGLDSADGRRDATILIIENLAQTVLGGGDFSAFERFVPPYAGILFYFYSFLISVILLNILVALFASAYQKIYDNANDEYMALVAAKTLKYIRAPDSCVFVPPLNIIELLMSPLALFLTNKGYHAISYRVMLVIYSPFLCYIAVKETKEARRVQYNRIKELSDDANEVDREWDLTDGYEDTFEGIFSEDGTDVSVNHTNDDLRAQIAAERSDPHFSVGKEWYNKVKTVSPPIEAGDAAGVGWELYPLYDKIDKLTKLVETVIQENKELKQTLAEAQ